MRQQLAQLQLHQLHQLGVVDHVGLVQEHHHRRNADLAGQQDVLAGLRHRAVRRRTHQDRAVHLRRPGDHVLDVVGVARAVDVGVVTILRLVLHVRRRDRDPALALFGSLVDLVERHELRPALVRQHLGDRRRQRRLAVVDVTDRPDVDVRLGPLKFRLRHRCLSSHCRWLRQKSLLSPWSWRRSRQPEPWAPARNGQTPWCRWHAPGLHCADRSNSRTCWPAAHGR